MQLFHNTHLEVRAVRLLGQQKMIQPLVGLTLERSDHERFQGLELFLRQVSVTAISESKIVIKILSSMSSSHIYKMTNQCFYILLYM